MSKNACPGCGGSKQRSAKICIKCLVTGKNDSAPPAERTVETDVQKRQEVSELASLKNRYKQSVDTIEKLQRELEAQGDLFERGIQTHVIEPHHGSGTSEATVVVPASDWHIEERVNPDTVSGLNKHNLEISASRCTKFFQGALRLTKLLQQDVRIEHMVMPLLGDFISNDIHEEFPENNELAPMDAIHEAENRIASGIEFILNNSNVQMTLPCHSGNHARTTKTTRFSNENGHSLEWLMYRHLADHFRSEARVKFVIPGGYHSYMDIYGVRLRFHHGHAIKYQGGVGGIFIPAYKAISQWNKGRVADLDVFGHFHQCKDGGNFVSNGSTIGYNGFALSIKADFEPPKQQLFLIDKKRGRTCTWPILVA